MNVVAIIAAKGNSTRLPGKNVHMFNNQPLLSYTIQRALESNNVGRVVVSTEDSEIAKVAQEYGAEVVNRPAWLADNKFIPEQVWFHALKEVELDGSYCADLVVGLNLCFAHREKGLIELAVSTVLDAAIETDGSYRTDGAVGGCIVGERTIRDLWTETKDGRFINLSGDIDYQNTQYRQPLYSIIEGLVTVMRADILREDRRLREDDNVKVITPNDPRNSLDIDTPFDFWISEKAADWSEE